MLKFNLRRELRLALLAATETCWVYAIVAYLAGLVEPQQTLTPLPFFIAYWIALMVGRALPRLKARWALLQAFAVSIAIVTLISVVRVELYPVHWYDLGWLPHFFATVLTFADGFATAHWVSLSVIYVFVRGLSLAQRPLTLWFIGLQFRLGIVIFFVFIFFAVMIKPADPSLWIFIFFFLSLIAIALARIDEMESAIRYGSRWAITILGAVALVLFIGLGVLQFFTVDTATALLRLLAPVWALFTALVILIAIPFGFLANWLVDLLRPLFQNAGDLFNNLGNLIPTNNNPVEKIQESGAWLSALTPIIQAIVALAIFFAVALWLARALNRRMQQYEDATYTRETIGNDEHADRAGSAQKSKPRPQARNLSAENIRRIYAALVARAAHAGIPRHADETPYEFLPRLTQVFPAESADLREITEAYIGVHYAEQTATPEQVSQVKAVWRRIEKIIKRTM